MSLALALRSRAFARGFQGRGVAARVRPGARLEVLSRHLTDGQLHRERARSRAALVAAATAAGMAAGGVLVAETKEKELSFAQIAKPPGGGA